MVSPFRGAVDFLDRLGVFEVVLPFLLVFTIVFAILERTRIFGTEKINDKDMSKKNLNAMVAFTTAFFVVASSKLVEVITKVSANMVLLLMLSVLFLLLVGSFSPEPEAGKAFVLPGFWRGAFIVIMFIGIVAIFLDAIRTDNQSWLQIIMDNLRNIWGNDAAATLVMILVIVGIMWYVVAWKPSEAKKST